MRKTISYILFLAVTLSCFGTVAVANQTGRKVEKLHMLIVFTKFKGEAPDVTDAPSWASEVFDGGLGSVNDFVSRVMFGIYTVTGEYTPKYYELPRPAEDYVPRNMNLYASDVMKLLADDPDFDFSDWDNDGSDGIPGNADDDGMVDYLVLMPRTRPYNFLFNGATGIFSLGLKDTYITPDTSVDGRSIMVDTWSGCIAVASSKNEAVGTIISEISHHYYEGAMDLMDKDYDPDSPATDSAGVGFWDFLGKGALGWNYQNGPMGPCAYNRIRMDCAGPHNTNLVKLFGFQESVPVKDVGQVDGKIYQIPVTLNDNEYFLVEYRRSGGLYYDRYIPEDGLLISHCYDGEVNNNEYFKLCDIECADGRYIDAGYPTGKKPDPINGGDNLDFWAHNARYTIQYNGNEGDSFDVFDGKRYTDFGSNTNPNTYSKLSKKQTGIEIFSIRKSASGDMMFFDCIVPPFHNWFEERYPFIGAAYHRFAATGFDGAAKAADQGVYVIRSGTARKPSTLVTISEDRLTVEELDMLAPYEVDDFVTRRLIRTEEAARNSIIETMNIELTDFSDIVSEFGVSVSELGRDGEPALVQKVFRYAGETVRPYQITLHQNYPNPFNAMTTISYVLPAPGDVQLEVYNSIGQKVMYIDRGRQDVGMHAVQIDAGGLASGVYLYRLRSGALSETRRFTYIR